MKKGTNSIKMNGTGTYRNVLNSKAVLIVLLVIIATDSEELIAQVRVTGHVFAEIVEPAAFKVNMNNDYILIDKDTLTNKIDLGEITLNESPERVVGVTIYSGGLKGNSGEIYSFDTFQCAESLAEITTCPKKEKVFKFTGMPDKNIVSGGDKYVEGKYQVVFLYN